VLADDLVGAIRDDVYPAFESYLRFLETEYRPREQPGLSSIRRGGETYAELVRQTTQSDLTAEAVHKIGVDELRVIHDEMRALGVREVRVHAEALKAEPRNHFASRDELLEAAQRLFDRASAQLPRLFGRLPLTPCRVIPIEPYREKDSVAAFYNAPSADGSRPGTYYVNTYRPETRVRYNLPALTVHESVPGHHLQIALQSEARDIPRFRRHRLGTQSALVAFTEGWGLYSERLGDEMGLYDGAAERFGMLSYQAWRAARLIVDTGMHALGWPRERAIRLMLDDVGLPENEVVNEVDRYITWPAQALAYKIGQRHHEALRKKARLALGGAFDVRAFHDELLRHGAIPLSTATLVIDGWLRVRAS
jgi:prolyl oligopeptidase